MPRDLPIGNGNLMINFDREYNIRARGAASFLERKIQRLYRRSLLILRAQIDKRSRTPHPAFGHPLPADAGRGISKTGRHP